MAKSHRLDFALTFCQFQIFIDTNVANTDRSLFFEFPSNMFRPAAPFDAFLYRKPCRIL